MSRNKHTTNTLCEISELWGQKKILGDSRDTDEKQPKAQALNSIRLLTATTEAKRQRRTAFKIPSFPAQPKRVHKSSTPAALRLYFLCSGPRRQSARKQ